MKVIIAGGTGFVGRHVTAALRAGGHHAVLLARGTREPIAEEGVEFLRCDVTTGELPLEALRGGDAIVNLIGVKREQGTQTFERGHVGVTRHLIAAAEALGIRRFIHVSVVGLRPDGRNGYHDTKWGAEELVRASGLGFSILKPGVIVGRGDPMVTRLVQVMRLVPIIPLAGKPDAMMQPVDVHDVARAVVEALVRDVSIGKSYDLVGPNPMTWRELMRTVAEGAGLRIWMVRIPIGWQRIAARLMELCSRDPLLTSWQLQMLMDGLYGDPAPARAELGIDPKPFTADTVRELEGAIPSLFGFSPRRSDRRG
jgi:NADH dehydrogenase